MKPVVCVCLAVWHFAKLCVSVNITQKKLLNRYAKTNMYADIQYILLFFLKRCHELLFALM